MDFFIINKIDINRTAIENKNNIINNRLGVNGFIVQLFSIFKNNVDFCLKNTRIETCEVCNNVKELNKLKKIFILY